MLKRIVALAFLTLAASVGHAGDWTVGVASGPFIFGDMARRESQISNGESTEIVTSSFSAKTRAGVTANVERMLNDRFSLRLDATFTRAPLAIKTERENEDSVSIEVGDLNATTFALTLAYRFNGGGALRPYLIAGPAYALYNVEGNGETGAIPLFEGTRGRAALIAGGGIEWWLQRGFAVRGELSDTYSERVLERSDFSGGSSKTEIERPHHVHTTVGIVFRF